jgi:hypothetical protein
MDQTRVAQEQGNQHADRLLNNLPSIGKAHPENDDGLLDLGSWAFSLSASRSRMVLHQGALEPLE